MGVTEKFLSYIKISSPSDENSQTCPSTKEQLEVAKFVAEEMKAIGIENVRMDKGYVYGEIPATKGYENKPCIGFIAHMDTAPAFNGLGVNPQIIENYCLQDIELKGSGHILSVKEFSVLEEFKGHTIITTDGTTLLGADDKAGIATIMQAAENIIKNNIPHGKIAIGFTPDEEIGRGADLFDVKNFGAQYAYTVDGSLPCEIEYQNFNAASLDVTVTGRVIHPGGAKGKLLNSIRVAKEFDNMLPDFEKPEYTEGFEGFFHLCDIKGTEEQTTLSYIIRDHDWQKFCKKQQLVKDIQNFLNSKYGENTVKVEIKETYRNMKEQILPHFHLIENARKAVEMVGLVPKDVAIRGGTDGARLSFMGLPCPNIGAGGVNFHGRYECITKENMELAVQIVENLVGIYAE